MADLLCWSVSFESVPSWVSFVLGVWEVGVLPPKKSSNKASLLSCFLAGSVVSSGVGFWAKSSKICWLLLGPWEVVGFDSTFGFSKNCYNASCQTLEEPNINF